MNRFHERTLRGPLVGCIGTFDTVGDSSWDLLFDRFWRSCLGGGRTGVGAVGSFGLVDPLGRRLPSEDLQGQTGAPSEGSQFALAGPLGANFAPRGKRPHGNDPWKPLRGDPTAEGPWAYLF